MWFKCKTCLAKDDHIAALNEQIKFLKLQLNPNASPFNQPLVLREADMILSAEETPIAIPDNLSEEQEAEVEEYKKAISERDRLLSGNY